MEYLRLHNAVITFTLYLTAIFPAKSAEHEATEIPKSWQPSVDDLPATNDLYHGTRTIPWSAADYYECKHGMFCYQSS